MEFDSLSELYKYLEGEDFQSARHSELTSAIRRLADKTIDDETKYKVKWETFMLDFMIQSGEVTPMSSTTSEEGVTIWAYPAYSDFGDNGLSYIKERANAVEGDHLIARYNHILWYAPAPHKHANQAKRAIDAYIALLSKSNCISEQRKDGRNCLELVKSLLTLSIKSKYKLDEVKTIIKNLLFGRRKISDHYKLFILDFMLELPQIKKDDYEGCITLVERILSAHKKSKSDKFFDKETCGTGLQLARKTGGNTKVWNKRIGDALVGMAEHRMNDETRMVPLSFLKEAIPHYKLAGLDKKVREIEHRYFELKKELKLSKIEVPLEDEAAESLHEYLKLRTEALMKLSAKDIFGTLLTGHDIFPKKPRLVKMAKDRNSAFLDLVTTMRFDINNNISKQKEDKATKEKAKIYENYHFYMQMSVLPLLHRVFIEGIKRDKITFEGLMKFLNEHTWFGQTIAGYDSGGDLVEYRWISLLAPAIQEYFKQTESALKSTNPFTNYVMPIDSLTLKFEGALRDFAAILNISTTVAGKGDILREKYIEELLAEKKMQEHFDEDDLLLFNYLFVAKDGMNLRNNIAHCFYRFNNYNFQIMHLLICAFLRLGKYKIRIHNS